MSPSRCPHSDLESRFRAHLLMTSEHQHRPCLQSTPSSTTAFHMHGLGGGNVCFPLSRRWMTSQTASLSGEHLQLKCLSLSAFIRLKRLSIERRAACPRDVKNEMVMFSRIQTECCMTVVCSDCRESHWTGCPPSPQSVHTARLGRPRASAATTSSTQTACVLCVAKGEERDAVWRCSEKNNPFLEMHSQTDFVTAEHKRHTLDSLGDGTPQSRYRKVQRKGSFWRTLASGRRTGNSL